MKEICPPSFLNAGAPPTTAAASASDKPRLIVSGANCASPKSDCPLKPLPVGASGANCASPNSDCPLKSPADGVSSANCASPNTSCPENGPADGAVGSSFGEASNGEGTPKSKPLGANPPPIGPAGAAVPLFIPILRSNSPRILVISPAFEDVGV